LPEVKAMPLARKPTTGTIASAMIRVRTEIPGISSLGEKRLVRNNGVTRVRIGNRDWPPPERRPSYGCRGANSEMVNIPANGL
jgi:hypothetical protein